MESLQILILLIGVIISSTTNIQSSKVNAYVGIQERTQEKVWALGGLRSEPNWLTPKSLVQQKI